MHNFSSAAALWIKMGLFQTRDVKKYNVRSNIDVKINDEFKASLDLRGLYRKNISPGCQHR